MKQSAIHAFVFAAFLLNISAAFAQNQPFTPDKTPDCNLAVQKGAQKSLNDYLLKEYNKMIKVDSAKALVQVENDPSLSRFQQELLRVKAEDKYAELSDYATKQYKCDLKNVDYPPLPEQY